MIIRRDLQSIIEQQLYKNKVIIIYGPRRVGKTTLCKQLLQQTEKSRYINCELLENKQALETTNSALLRQFLGAYRLIVFDEAQSINNIGLILKIIADTFPEIQIIATGSSSFELGSSVSEPLTGRSREYRLYPLSMSEMLQYFDKIELQGMFEKFLRFGLYPEVVQYSDQEAIEEINNIASNYLYKDILQFEQIKRSDLLLNLLKALALQLGNEVSYQELSRLVGSNVLTVQRYIELLEKTFVIFRLKSFSRNLRKEIAKGQKIFFYDIGIRNSLIQNFNAMSLRTDSGAIWENFCIVERMKANQNRRKFVNNYFWRTYDQKEIDLIEESGGTLKAFEFKYGAHSKSTAPKDFLNTYTNTEFMTVHPANFWEYIDVH